MEVEGIRKWKFLTESSAAEVAKHGRKTTQALLEQATTSVSSTIARRVATVTATLLPDTVTNVPTRIEEKADVDNGLSCNQSESSNEDLGTLDTRHIEIPFSVEDAVKEELISNPSLFHDGVNVASVVIGADNTRVAVKQVHAREEFERELRVLNQIQNPSCKAISAAVASFKTGEKHYIIFPWAEHGSLRDFWNHNPDATQLAGDTEFWLIQQCLGISEALQELHGYKSNPMVISRGYARHGDIKPENILVFSSDQTHQDTHGSIVSKPGLGQLKLADFGITSFQKSQAEEAIVGSVAFSPTYRPPEMDITNASINRSADVWSLGCVFLEFATWYVLGAASLEAFSNTRLDANKNFQTRTLIEDTFFTVDSSGTGPPKVERNPAATELIAKLRKHSRSTKTIHAFLNLIEDGMLQIPKDKRATTPVVAETLRNLLNDLSTSLTITEASTMREDIESSDQEQLRLTLYDTHNPPSAFDRWRIWLEDCIGLGPVDWSPLPPVNRLKSATNSKLSWFYNNRELSIILDKDETDRCLGIVPLAMTENTSMSVTDSPEGQGQTSNTATSINPSSKSQSRTAEISKAQVSTPRKKGTRGKMRQSLGPNKKARLPSPSFNSDLEKECYFCVDKATFTKRGTYFSTPVAPNDLSDDAAFFKLLKARLRSASGRLLFGFAPWMAYNAVNLCQFSFMNDNSDLVAAFDLEEFPREESVICAGYSFDSRSSSITASLPLDISMRKLGKTILAGLERPDDGWGRRNVLNALPKRHVPPTLPRTYETTGWGFHVRFGVSFLSVAFWVTGLVLLGLAFVPFWLVLIDKKDLQNAFTPASTLFSIAAMLLAWAALVQNNV